MLRLDDHSIKAESARGSILLEALIAVLIFSLGILGLIGLQATLMKNTTEAKARIDASLIANQRIARMWVDRDNLSNYAGTLTAGDSSSDPDQAQISLFPNGSITTAVANDVVTVTVNWQLPGQIATSNFVTVARINGNSTSP